MLLIGIVIGALASAFYTGMRSGDPDRLGSGLKQLLEVPRVDVETPMATLPVDRHRLPGIRSLNFVIHGILEEGVAASTRQDPQAKSLGEWLRARVVEIPEALLP